MNCRDLETQLTPYLDGELIAEARAEFEGHLASCPTCSRHVEVDRHNLSTLRAAMGEASPGAPAAFKARLFENIARDSNRQERLSVGRVAAIAAGVTFALVAGHHAYRQHQRHLYEQDAAMRHARQFPLEIQQTPDAIERWFGGKLDHPVNVPRFPNATATGARLLQVRDKPAAYIRYDSARPMGLFVFGDDHDLDVGPKAELGSSHGYNVVSWREGDVVYQLVGRDVDEQDIRELLPPTAGQSSEMPVSTPALDLRPVSLQQ